MNSRPPKAPTRAELYAHADAYLAAAPDIIHRLYTTSYDLQDFVSSAKWCRLGLERYPQQARFHSCQLWLMGTDVVPQPDISVAWAMVDRVAERTPSGASSEKPEPRPGTTSMISWVWDQYSNCAAPMKKGQPAISPRRISCAPVRNSPSAKHIGALPSQQPPD